MWILIEGGWGATYGILMGKSLRHNEALKTEMVKFAHDRGLDERTVKPENLSQDDKKKLQEILMKDWDIQSVVGFWPTAFVCVMIFGIIGLVTGYLTRSWQYALFFPLISFTLNNPLIRFAVIKNMPVTEKFAVFIFAQVCACYFFAYLGALCAKK